MEELFIVPREACISLSYKCQITFSVYTALTFDRRVGLNELLQLLFPPYRLFIRYDISDNHSSPTPNSFHFFPAQIIQIRKVDLWDVLERQVTCNDIMISERHSRRCPDS